MAGSIAFTLPVPPSTNDLYQPAIRWGRNKQTGQRYRYQGQRVRPEIVAYRDVVAFALLEYKRLVRKPYIPENQGPLALSAHVYFPSDDADLDNSIKPLQDAVARSLEFNDKRIYAVHFWKHVDERDPRAEVRLEWGEPGDVCEMRIPRAFE